MDKRVQEGTKTGISTWFLSGVPSSLMTVVSKLCLVQPHIQSFICSKTLAWSYMGLPPQVSLLG